MLRRLGRVMGVVCAFFLVWGVGTTQFGFAQPAQEWSDADAALASYRELRPEFGAATSIIDPQALAAAPADAVLTPRAIDLFDAVSGEQREIQRHRLQEAPGLQPWEFGPTDNLEDLATLDGVQAYTHTINTSFAGLNRVTGAGGGFIWVPPDTVVAKGPAKVLEAVNSALRLFTTGGGVIQTMDLNTFFSYAAGGDSDRVLFDPKVFYDRNATNPRFYIVALDAETNPNISRIYVAVSRSTNPANLNAANWCRYFIDGRRNVGTVNESWADYPGLGVGRDALLITANQFRFSNNTFTFAIIRALNKNILSNNAGGCPASNTIPLFTWQPSATLGDGTVFTLQPAQSYTSPTSFTGTTNPAYIINTIAGTSATYRVWRIRNVAGGAPTLGGPVNLLGNFTYALPPLARQSGGGTTSLLDTGSQRMVQAAGVGNAIYGVHGTACQFSASTILESCVRYIRLLVGQNGAGALTAAISQQITFGGGDNIFYFWPGIAVNLAQKIMVVWQRSSTTSFLSAWRTGKTLSALGFEPPVAIRNGTCTQTAYTRTGDYVGAQTDPGGTTFWVAGEMAIALTAGGTGCNWGTWIQQLTPP
jgi:hypothetical protein